MNNETTSENAATETAAPTPTQLYAFKCNECDETVTAEWDIAGDRHEAIDCVSGTLVYVGPIAPATTQPDIEGNCSHGTAKFLRCEQCVNEGVYTYAIPSATTSDEFSAEMQKQPEDRAPETFSNLLDAALAHGAEQDDEDFDAVSPNDDGQGSPVANQEPEGSVNVAPEPENTLESILDTENSTVAPADEAIEPEQTLGDILPDFDTISAGENVAKETVVLEMHVRRPSFRRAFRSEDIIGKQAPVATADDGEDDGEKKVDANYIHVSKDIIDRNEIRNINKRIGTLKSYMRTRCVPTTFLASGWYMLPKKFINDMDAAVISTQNDVAVLLEKFGERYPAMIEAAKLKLGPHFNQNDYPPFDVLKNQWSVDAQWRDLRVPSMLATVNKEILKREQEKVKLQFADTAQEIRDALRVGFTRMVSEFSSKLGTDTETGKPKVFQKQRVTKLLEFVDNFDGARDLTNDFELQKLVKQARALIIGVDPKSLRKDDALRTSIEAGFKNIAEEASKLVVVRQRVLADDEDEV